MAANAVNGAAAATAYPLAPLPKTVANERNQQQLNLIANNIGGTAEQLRRQLAQVEAGVLLFWCSLQRCWRLPYTHGRSRGSLTSLAPLPPNRAQGRRQGQEGV